RAHPREAAPGHLRSLAIFRGDVAMYEQARETVQETRELVVARRKRETPHLGQLQRYLRQLHRVVIDEHTGVQPEVELASQLANLRGFGVVAGDDRDEVLFSQHHAPGAERRRHHVVVVAAHRREERALTPEPAQQTLIDEVAVASPRGP